jgi:hypothetical protein
MVAREDKPYSRGSRVQVRLPYVLTLSIGYGCGCVCGGGGVACVSGRLRFRLSLPCFFFRALGVVLRFISDVSTFLAICRRSRWSAVTHGLSVGVILESSIVRVATCASLSRRMSSILAENNNPKGDVFPSLWPGLERSSRHCKPLPGMSDGKKTGWSRFRRAFSSTKPRSDSGGGAAAVDLTPMQRAAGRLVFSSQAVFFVFLCCFS